MAFPKISLSENQPAPPCPKDCPDRTATCHSECAIYKQYFEECERIRQKKLIDCSLDEQRCDGIHRQEKKKHYHNKK